MSHPKKHYSHLFYKELALSLLALLSIALVIIEYLLNVSEQIKVSIVRFDILVAIIFLIDFTWYFMKSKRKLKYIKSNWFLLLASIPIVDSWAELLRGLRLFELVRLVRAGEHLNYVINGQGGKNANSRRL